MTRLLFTICFVLACATTISADDAVEPIAIVALDRNGPVIFERDVEPILAAKCKVCHSGSVTEGKFDLGNYTALLKGGKRGAAIVPGKSAESLLVKLAGRTAKPAMPPEDEEQPLTPQELALIKLWIDQGAKSTGQSSQPPKVVLQPLSPAVRLVRAVAISPDKSIVAAGRANEIHLYDAASGECVRTLSAPEFAAASQTIVESLAFSPDSQLLASGSFREIAVWDVKSGTLRYKLAGFADRVVALAFSPDGQLLAAAGGAATVNGEVKLFDTANGKLVLDITEDSHSDTVFGLAFSPDGTKLATCGADQSIKIFEVPGGKRIKSLEGHTHHVLGVSWKGDGKMLASAGADKKVRLWDYETGEQLTKINRGGGQITTIMLDHDKQVSRVQFIGTSSQVITCSGDRGARLWNVELETRPGNYTTEYYAGRMLRTFGAGTDYLYAAAASPDGTLIATGGESGAVHLYNAADAKLLHTLAPPAR